MNDDPITLRRNKDRMTFHPDGTAADRVRFEQLKTRGWIPDRPLGKTRHSPKATAKPIATSPAKLAAEVAELEATIARLEGSSSARPTREHRGLPAAEARELRIRMGLESPRAPADPRRFVLDRGLDVKALERRPRKLPQAQRDALDRRMGMPIKPGTVTDCGAVLVLGHVPPSERRRAGGAR